jgi:hypothetical protein
VSGLKEKVDLLDLLIAFEEDVHTVNHEVEGGGSKNKPWMYYRESKIVDLTRS